MIAVAMVMHKDRLIRIMVGLFVFEKKSVAITSVQTEKGYFKELVWCSQEPNYCG